MENVINDAAESLTGKSLKDHKWSFPLAVAMKATGSVLNGISSIGGVNGSKKFPGLSAYSSSKAAVIALTEVLAEEHQNGPSFNVLALGAVQTKMLKEAFPDYKVDTKPEEMAKYILDFAINGNKLFNGKLISVSNSNP